MVKVKIKKKFGWMVKGDYVVSEVGEHFAPFTGASQFVWNGAGREKLSALRSDISMVDYEIKETSAFSLGRRFPGGIIHIKLPFFPPSDQDEGNNRLRECYRAILKKAVERDAKTLVIPFIGLFSVDFSIDHGVDIALETIHNFICESKTGKLDKIYLCTTSRPAYERAIKHDKAGLSKRSIELSISRPPVEMAIKATVQWF